MSEQNKPAPVWRLLEPGEIIREGDQFPYDSDWRAVSGEENIGQPCKGGRDIIRRRMEPDPVKAELLAALTELEQRAGLWLDLTGSHSGAKNHAALQAAQAAIARATA